LALLALSLSHPAIKNLLARSLLSTWSFWGPYFQHKLFEKENADVKFNSLILVVLIWDSRCLAPGG
jgi:hypothetical protein